MAVVTACAAYAFAYGSATEGDSSRAPVTFSGNGYFTFGQIVRGYEVSRDPIDKAITKKWVSNVGAKILMSSRPQPWLTLTAGLEINSWLPISSGLTDHIYDETDTINKPDLLHRMPLVVGINLPGFNIIDVINLEFEYLNYPYEISYLNAMEQNPKPAIPSDSLWKNAYENDDNVRWSIYLKKNISRFSLVFQVAKDHMRVKTKNPENRACFEQTLRTSKDWRWQFKMQANF